ncbi:MAG: glycosyltransferase [Planctomycetales bacterium]|nr:glycosyltransferase [Planctomycetales bacterium]
MEIKNFNPRSKKKLRVGIWCAYHITLEQSEGIGVFAHNLARGLANLPTPVQVTMVSKPGEEHVMANTVRCGGGNIKVRAASPIRGMLKLRQKFWRTAAKHSANWQKRLEEFQSSGEKLSLRMAFAQLCNQLGCQPSFSSSRRGKLIRTLLLPVLGLVILGNRIYREMLRNEVRLARYVAQLTRMKQQYFDSINQIETQRIIESCDVWVIPYVGLFQSFSKPTVVTIHDLVCYHFPEVTDPSSLQTFKMLAESVSGRSTVAATMSHFIRDNDLKGILNLPDEKIRVVAPAAPTDFGRAGNAAEITSRYPILNEEFIFYPSAFRSYKNHELLVSALDAMQQQGDTSLHLVFTGIHAAKEKLLNQISAAGLQARVHILGKVDRDALSVFYKKSLATIVSSRYEQGSFPLMEAMYWGCPIACSSIASLKELFAPMGDAMHYFDVDDVPAVVRIIEHFRQHRSEVIRAQQATREALFGRTWVDAAKDWREVLEYAIELEAQKISRQAKVLGRQAA